MTLRTFAVLAPLGLVVAATAQTGYLALGDSVAYGLQPDASNPFGYNVPSNGDRGYVAAIADALGSGAARPTVIDLALPDESSSSFYDTTDPYGATNTNYGLGLLDTRTVSQNAFAQSVIGTYGSSIKTVSFALGANDFLSLTGLMNLTPTQIATAFASIDHTYTTFLGGLRTALPNARLILPGYYDPYPVGNPLHPEAETIIQTLNTEIQGYAAAYHGTYVDFYTPINGNQATLIASDGIHPNDAGYAVLGRAAAQAVPEPGTWAALGLGGLALMRRRRK